MRSFVRVSTFCTVIAAALSVPPTVDAQSVVEPRSITVTPFLSTSFGTSQDLGSSLGIGAAIGYDMTTRLGFEAEFARVFDVAGDTDNLDYSLTNISGNVLYHFPLRRVTPYAVFGIGWERANVEFDDVVPVDNDVSESTTEVAWNIGGGAKMEINDRFLARADLRRFQANDLAPDHWRLYGGLTFFIKR